MRLLLDTHALLWWATAPEQLSPRAKATIADPTHQVLISVASAWETEIKVSLGKLKVHGTTSDLFKRLIVDHDFQLQGIKLSDIDRLAKLAPRHRDPFDRMLVAQSMGRDATLVTKDTVLRDYGVATLW